MSKVDALRALREAKHSRGGAPPEPPGPRGAGGAAAAAAPARRATPRPEAAEVDADLTGAVAPDELCGHRNMGGKSCSRPAGHSEKNHRYR